MLMCDCDFNDLLHWENNVVIVNVWSRQSYSIWVKWTKYANLSSRNLQGHYYKALICVFSFLRISKSEYFSIQKIGKLLFYQSELYTFFPLFSVYLFHHPLTQEWGAIQKMGNLWDKKLGIPADKMCGNNEIETRLTTKLSPSNCLYIL